jgi:hypothetical protein
MKSKIFKYLSLVIFFPFIYIACGDNADEISFGYDREVPQVVLLADSLEVAPLQEVTLKAELSDNAGLSKLVFTYGNWAIAEAVELKDNPKTCAFERTLTIPADAEKEWSDFVTLNTGETKPVTETYHKLALTVTDINMNLRTVYIYIKVK